jgi:hypothetical protein
MSTLQIPSFEEPTQITITSREFDEFEKIVCQYQLDLFIPDILDTDKEIKDCKIYIPPSCLLSRHDIKNYCELYNCKRVLDPTKADYIIINETYLPEVSLVRIWYDYNNNFAYTNARTNTMYGGYKYKKQIELFIFPDDYAYIINNQTKIVHSKNILTRLYNKSNLSIIDEKFYITLDTLFKSDTEEEVKLAVSLIENSNIRKSLIHILLLLTKHKFKITDYGLENRVKFSSMLHFITGIKEKDKSSNTILKSYISDSTFFEILECHDCLTRYNINILMKYIKKHTEDHIRKWYNSDDIIIKLSLSDSMINKIKENEVNPNQLSLFQDGTN